MQNDRVCCKKYNGKNSKQFAFVMFNFADEQALALLYANAA